MTTRQIRKRCQALVDGLTLPVPFTVDALLDGLAAQRGRPIELLALPPGMVVNACGLWIATDTHDEIYVEEKTTALHREHIILHEIGHILCDHESSEEGGQVSLAKFLPDLSPELIERLLARTNYTSEQEQEAELVASLIRTAAGTRTAASTSGGALGELEAALGIRSKGRGDNFGL
ncbi:hypothetical protein JOF53_001726 [Crossiella equi]|uniref:IrrE N-terminal-like domain-containing protein n=1 Tax=Crossiella equi TaxID=130796 RepID=A0ABS5A9F6_9PSEU|nr:hypothetical protein [Crossiella equi]MBP2472854.1 hypothetical protein [Crossiella equi]